MAELAPALEKVLKWEGGRVDDPNDLGGRTAYGITQRTYNQYYEGDVWDITPIQIRTIYRAGYWNKISGDSIENQSIAEFLFDWAVNCGPSTAIKKVQALLRVDTDGIMGKKTLQALNAKNGRVLFNELLDTRIAYYKLLVQKRPSQQKYLKGWLNRTKSYTYKNNL